ncbi:hypothetical protein L914_00289 [Phytophthora nicotianae]|uniref:Uncharacterized protein n=1 Tax=Phytophthora nicotianae TaxID=4792 RepID=W2P7M4_PHYNI|nr:hypothetical protein L914_00289 [Phytophthora nicotianae]
MAGTPPHGVIGSASREHGDEDTVSRSLSRQRGSYALAPMAPSQGLTWVAASAIGRSRRRVSISCRVREVPAMVVIFGANFKV